MKKPVPNIKDRPEWKELEHRVRTELIPEMRQSQVMLVLAPPIEQKFNLELAIQIGAAVLLGKPFILMKSPGQTLMPKLEMLADRIIEGDMKTDGDAMREQLAAAFRDFEKQ